MCGYLGILSTNEIDQTEAQIANNNLICRGPDSKKDIFSSTSKYNNHLKNFNFSFIFNRLSILDLSEKADQPMYSKKFNTAVMFNGEIFNHAELRKELESEGVQFKTDHSDSEVVLLGLSYKGLSFLDKLIGQFAVFFIDYENMVFHLIRDRLGQKPLFYSVTSENITFGSNLKSIARVSKNKDYNFESIGEYFSLGVVTAPNTIFKNIYKVEPGEIATFNLLEEDLNPTKIKYWNIDELVGNQNFNDEEFLSLLSDAVNIRVNADVDVANFLSGGLDSTSIIKIQEKNNINTNSFSVGYEDSKYDESIWFNKVAKIYNTNHRTKNIGNNFKLDDILNSINIFDEPYADPSTVPSYILSKEISKFFKVAISGDGGDELFGGYTRTLSLLSNRNNIQNIYSKLFYIYPSFLGTGNNLRKYSSDILKAYSSYFEDTKLLNLLGINTETKFNNTLVSSSLSNYKKMQLIEYKLYLSEMMMLKVDRTSMANSLEVRSPFVDHRLIEYMLNHNETHIDPKNSKQILKNLINEDFDSSFLNRKKMGFVFNIEEWIYQNLDLVQDRLINGKIIKSYNSNIVNLLKINKSRMNANRLWKIFFLEEFLDGS
ncbi:MAG: asparagine synthase (glutamine-hydrolyzing) [Euryarchaeota archaeon]|nr:asparagine synthase (glutamine-hydrolyzing) [Euryarchaeota archaeon]|tara:strand:- start:5064 stop:6869 length:1806 start_codon:yes stop_codon:yes gene_type:complete